MTLEKITLIGAGAWGCTLAELFHQKGLRVTVWEHHAERAALLRGSRTPFGVPMLHLSTAVEVEHDLLSAVADASVLVIVCPSQVIRSTAKALAEVLKLSGAAPAILLASKGLDLETHQPLTAVLMEFLPKSSLAVVSGPCIAREVAEGVPTSVVVASDDAAFGERMIQLLHTPRLRCYAQQDVLGVELGGALKNVIAIAAGISDGLGFGENSKSALLTRGLAEMNRFAVAFGANPLTITGLAGLGDLAVTCFSPHSRNRTFGEHLGKGLSAEEAKLRIGMTVEGEPTSRAALQMAADWNQRNPDHSCPLELPITETVAHVCAGTLKPAEAVHRLMTRGIKSEFQ